MGWRKGLAKEDDGWRMPDEQWAKLEPLLRSRPEHPLGCHSMRMPAGQTMNAIFLVLRTDMQWGALRATGSCHPSSAYRRFREWLAAGVFREFWRQGLLAYDLGMLHLALGISTWFQALLPK